MIFDPNVKNNWQLWDYNLDMPHSHHRFLRAVHWLDLRDVAPDLPHWSLLPGNWV